MINVVDVNLARSERGGVLWNEVRVQIVQQMVRIQGKVYINTIQKNCI
jgi:outer membrane lipopolysaccharide assembly protein LptE/RlpB